MPNILITSLDVPDTTFGGRKRIYHCIKSLIEHGHTIVFIVLVPGNDHGKLNELKKMGIRCIEIPSVPEKPRHSSYYKYKLLKGIISSTPRDLIDENWPNQIIPIMVNEINHNKFDLVINENEVSAILHKYIPSHIPSILNTQNISSHKKQKQLHKLISQHASIHERILVQLDIQKWIRYEKDNYKKYTQIAVVSNNDKLVCNRYGLDKITVIENGVDLLEYSPQEKQDDNINILFTGSMSYEPNIDGVCWFLDEIWMQIKQRLPTARFQIVGAEPPKILGEKVQQYPDVILTGWVDSTTSYFASASVVVVPLRLGGGTRLKILEAAAMNRPIVSTTIGAEGLEELIDGESLVISDSPIDFAEAVTQLVNDEEYAKVLSTNARKTVCELYDWNTIGKKLNSLVMQTIDQRH